MNEEPRSEHASTPTPEQFVARYVRLLRQVRGWSQQEFAEKMQAYGYGWSQATVARLESASRPIRVNELADLAALFGIPITQFVEFRNPGWDDPEALRKEIASLEAERGALGVELDMAQAAFESASMHSRMVAAEMARVEVRLRTLGEWASASGRAPTDHQQGVDGQ